jgi:glycosyltransferase involved in cell wall biosynthesis
MRKLVVIPSDPIEAYELKGTSSWLKEYYNPNNFFDEVYVLSPIETIEREVYGLKIIPITSNKHYKQQLNQIKPICVRTYGGYWATDYGNYNKVKGIPVISSVHDTNPDLIHKSLKFSDYIIVMSDVIKKTLLKENLAYSKDIYTLGNRVDPGNFKSLDVSDLRLKEIKETIPYDKFILLIGRKTDQKNIDNVLKAMNSIPEGYGLVLAGQGNMDQYDKTIIDYNLVDRVLNIETIQNSDLPYYYNLASLLCNPSKWEGFGVVFIEAAFCKCKIVSSNIAPMNEFILNDGIMNYLVDDFESSKAIAKGINELLGCPEINDDTYNFIFDKFSKKVVASNEVDCYNNTQSRGRHFSLSYLLWKTRIAISKSKRAKIFIK